MAQIQDSLKKTLKSSFLVSQYILVFSSPSPILFVPCGTDRCRAFFLVSVIILFYQPSAQPPTWRASGITLCLAPTYRPVWHVCPCQEYKTPANIHVPLGVTRACNLPYHDKVAIPIEAVSLQLPLIKYYLSNDKKNDEKKCRMVDNAFPCHLESVCTACSISGARLLLYTIIQYGDQRMLSLS